MAYDERMTSEFNEAQLQILRLNQIWQLCEAHRDAGHLVKWRWKMDGAEIELMTDIKRLNKQKAKEEYIKTLGKINEEIDYCKDKAELYQKLKKKMEFLKEIQDVAGKGARYRHEDEDRIE